jgi:tRNA-binding EMAP/Myf-like protein
MAFDDKVGCFQQELKDHTDADKLAKCEIDLREARLDPCECPAAVPPLFVITLIYNNNNYDA